MTDQQPLRFSLPLPGNQSLCAFCRNLVDDGADPDQLIEFYRGDTNCFTPTSIGWFADRQVQENASSGARFRRFREFRWSGEAPAA